MTSVPKPLKFLRPQYDTLKATFAALGEGENKRLLADIISLLAMTHATDPATMPDSLRFRLLGSSEEIGSFGHEVRSRAAYALNLVSPRSRPRPPRPVSNARARARTASTCATWLAKSRTSTRGATSQARPLARLPPRMLSRRPSAGEDTSLADLLPLVRQIVPFHMRHNAEPEAVDLLLEVERLDLLLEHVDKGNYARTALYLVSCASYLAEPEDAGVLRVAHSIYLQCARLPEALRCALKLGLAGAGLVTATWQAADDTQVRRQLAYQLARAGVALNLEEGPCAVTDDVDALKDILSNAKLSEHYLALARDLDVMESKTPEDIYKTHLVEGRAPSGAAAVDSARANLASTFVNAFVNCGFGSDKLLTKDTSGEGTSSEVSWIYKNKEHGKMAAAASLGAILLWDVEGGLPQIDKYLYAADSQVVAGALLAVGIVNCGVRNEMDPAFALLHESVGKEAKEVRQGALLGLGLAYAGQARAEVSELLCPLLQDDSTGMDVLSYAALALGLVFVGSCDAECVQALLTVLMTRGEADLAHPLAKLLCLSLGLLFLGRGAAAEATGEVLRTLQPRISRFACVALDACAFAATGNVLKVQQFLALIGERVEGAAEEGCEWMEEHQSAAVLGVALVACGEDVGSEMALRALERVLQYGEVHVRKAVPLALALLSSSKPQLTVTDCLGRLAHDPHEEVAAGAVLGLGLVAAGTNNARVAGQLRQLSSYYYKEPNLLFLVRVAQGLVHLGKGLLSLHPLHSDRALPSATALAALATVAFAALDAKETLLGKHACLLYSLFPAISPRMLHTVDQAGAPLPVPVRVGEALDTVAQAGRPKTITGFQTHTTPVLLAVGERAELGTEQYLACSPILEGVVVLRPNPDYQAASS